jgi:hypothetical protein
MVVQLHRGVPIAVVAQQRRHHIANVESPRVQVPPAAPDKTPGGIRPCQCQCSAVADSRGPICPRRWNFGLGTSNSKGECSIHSGGATFPRRRNCGSRTPNLRNVGSTPTGETNLRSWRNSSRAGPKPPFPRECTCKSCWAHQFRPVVELEDALVSKASTARCAGAIPVRPTNTPLAKLADAQG